jgi:hypothetical protein
MISLWIVIGLIISTVSVATLAAIFSIVGLGALFSGAVMAVFAMAGSLEFSKFVLTAYLHQRWNDLNKVFRGYLVFAIVVLSLITSMGVFGFLSDAYQSASTALDSENVKLQSEKNKQNSITNELMRINKTIDEIPVTRISKKMRARQEAEPLIRDLNSKYDAIEKTIAEMNLKVIEIKKKVGPLIYISRAFNADIDTVVKYLILVFVLVFDPLAICLVIATTQALESRKHKSVKFETQQTMAPAVPEVAQLTPTVQAATEPVSQPTLQPIQALEVPTASPATAEQEELIQMNYADDPQTPEESETKEPKVV